MRWQSPVDALARLLGGGSSRPAAGEGDPDSPFVNPPHPELADYPAVGGGADYVTGAPPSTAVDPPPAERGFAAADADRVVSSADAFVDAVEGAAPGDVVFVPGDAELDLTGREGITPAAGVVVASDRGRPTGDGASPGALLFAADHPQPLFAVRDADVHLTGLRVRLPQLDYREWEGYDASPVSTAVAVDAPDVTVSNCVVRGCAHAAVEVGRDGAVSPRVHHCALADNPMGGLGYGLQVFHGSPVVAYCYFDNNRHAVAASGYEDCGYVARYNFVGERTGLHVFDVHGADGHAGDRVELSNNVVKATTTRSGRPTQAVRLRGPPRRGALVARNWFAHAGPPDEREGAGRPSDAVLVDGAASFAAAGVEVTDNHYGPERPPDGVGLPRA